MTRYAATFSILLALIATPYAQVPQHGHVVIVLEENHNYSSVTTTSMPYLTGLASKYGLATQYYANTHPSIGNYFMLTTGQIITNIDSMCPTSFPVSADNVVRELLLDGKTWKDYAEDLPAAGSLSCSSGNYVARHNPLPYFTDVQNSSVQRLNLVPFQDPNVGFAHDLANGTLPDYSFIVPNLCDDAHNCSLTTADNWLKANIDPLVKNAGFQQDGLLIVAFDESAGDNTNGGGRVYWVAVGPKVKTGYQSTFSFYLHQSTLRLTMEALGITGGFPGAASRTPSMAEFFGTSVPAITVATSPTSATVASSGTQQFTATVTGTTNTGVTWTATKGTISSSGLYTAPTVTSNTTATVTATSVADTTKSASATVTITAPAAVAVTISPTSATITSGGAQQFTATVSNATNTSVTWSASTGTVSTSGLYTAPTVSVNTSATVKVTSAADPTKSASANVTVTPHTSTLTLLTLNHYEYVFPDSNIYVYDIDNGFKLVKHLSLPTSAGVRGSVASAATGKLYVSYGSDKTGGSMLAYDLANDKVLWQKNYSFGIDSMSVSPDGKTIYMPDGEISTGNLWQIIDASTGTVTGSINGCAGPHNTVINAAGTRVYLGCRDYNYFETANTSNNTVFQKTGPLRASVRPFTINGKETLAFVTETGFLGFQVLDLVGNKILYTVPVAGFSCGTCTSPTAPSHGISISPDEREIYLIDAVNSYVHVFDISGLPGSAPKQVADIKLVNPLGGNESGCAYDCLKDGWLHHSRDGRYVFVGDSGDVIDTGLRKTVATLPAMANTRKEIEIDFQNNAVVWAMNNRSSVGMGAATTTSADTTPPTVSISSPPNGATVSGTVTVSATASDNVGVTKVELYVDGALKATDTVSPYSFSWDTTTATNGSHSLTAKAYDAAANVGTSSAVSVTVSNVVAVTISPTSATVSSGGTQQFTATVTGSTNTSVTWSASAGTISSSGLYTAPTVSVNTTATVKATSVADPTRSATASVTITPPLTVAVTISPTSATVASGGAQQFTDTVTGTTNSAVTWSASAGTVSTSGLYTAPTVSVNTSATVKVTSVADPTKSATASVTITPPLTMAVTISPTSATVASGGAQQFTDTVTGTTNSAVTWSASAGTVSTSGLYTAPTVSVNTSATVKVTSVADPTKSATASITITPPPPSPTNPNFSLSVTPLSQTVVRGSTTNYTIKLTPSSGFSGSVAFAVTGLSGGASASFSPASVTVSGTTSASSTMTIATNKGRTGTFTPTISASGGVITHTTSVSLTTTK